MAGEHYTKGYPGGFSDDSGGGTPIVAAILNKMETTLLYLLGADPTDKAAQVWDAALGRFKTALIKNENIDPAAAIDKSKLAALSLTDADIAVGAAISQSKLNLDSSTLGRAVAWGKNIAPVSTTGTTFAAGADLLTAALSFTADGVSTYRVVVAADYWINNVNNATQFLHINLDGADAGEFGSATIDVLAHRAACRHEGIFTPSAASHTLNVRLRATAGTVTVQGGAGGVGVATPIFVALFKV